MVGLSRTLIDSAGHASGSSTCLSLSHVKKKKKNRRTWGTLEPAEITPLLRWIAIIARRKGLLQKRHNNRLVLPFLLGHVFVRDWLPCRGGLVHRGLVIRGPQLRRRGWGWVWPGVLRFGCSRKAYIWIRPTSFRRMRHRGGSCLVKGQIDHLSGEMRRSRRWVLAFCPDGRLSRGGPDGRNEGSRSMSNVAQFLTKKKEIK